MFLMLLIAGGNIFGMEPTLLYEFGGLVDYDMMSSPLELYRLISSMFLHAGIIHLTFNLYALYILGPQLESFFGKAKFLSIYLISGLIGGFVSIIFQGAESVSVGASGAIFGLIGAFLYFGYHYRVYFGSVIKSQIIPLLVLNLFIGFMSKDINMAAHIGGLIGGVLISKAVGIKYKTTTSDSINGWIMLVIFCVFLIFMSGVL